jgi:hypothetical protein
VVETLPVKVAEVIDVGVKSSECAPRIALQLAGVIVAILRKGFVHLFQKTFCHLQRELSRSRSTLTLAGSERREQSSALTKSETKSLRQELERDRVRRESEAAKAMVITDKKKMSIDMFA